MSDAEAAVELDAAPEDSVLRPGPEYRGALLAVQRKVQDLKLQRASEGQVGNQKTKYLDLPALLKEVRPLLSENALVWSTFPTTLDGKPALRYRMMHEPSGQGDEGVMLLQLDKQTSQGQGSAITYARRYALQSILEITPDGDDDGRAASEPRAAPVDPEAPMSVETVGHMQAAIRQLGLDQGEVESEAGIAPEEHPTVEQGERVREILSRVREERAK